MSLFSEATDYSEVKETTDLKTMISPGVRDFQHKD
jgi:hypothetical protein